MQQLEPLRPYLYIQAGYSRQVAAGSVQASDKSNLDRVDRHPENDWNGGRRRLRRHRCSSTASRNDSYLTVSQFGRERR
jgi:hypothetical protein